MKTYSLLTIISLFLLFISCKKNVYHSFTDEERGFMVYNIGDTFKVKNENTGDTITFNITEKDIHYKKDYGPKILPSRKEHYMEEGRIRYSNSLGYNSLDYIYIYKDKIDQFTLSISIWLDQNNYGTSIGDIDNITTVSTGGMTYNNVYVFSGDNNTKCYFSIQYGFVKLEDLNNSIVYTRIP